MTKARNTDVTPSAEKTLVVDCDGITRTYKRGRSGGFFSRADVPTVQALDDISLSISSGEFVGIAGPSGSGKSTLLHILAALDTPTAGQISLAGEDITNMGERARAKIRRERVGIVFQRFHLLPSLTAVSNVALPLVELGWSKRKRRDRARTLLEQVGLDDRVTHRPGKLSGGEQQRVAIARALATEPDLVIADEPTGELDSHTSTQILDLLQEVATKQTVILASHDQQALGRVQRYIELRDGTIVEDTYG